MTEFYEGQPWTEMALRDLRGEVQSGSTPEEAAGHLLRSVEEVKRKAQELGLKWRGQGN